MIGTPLAGRTGRQVTNQVTTAPGNARPGETSSDAARGLACDNRTQRDAFRRNRAAWHAEGQAPQGLSCQIWAIRHAGSGFAWGHADAAVRWGWRRKALMTGGLSRGH